MSVTSWYEVLLPCCECGKEIGVGEYKQAPERATYAGTYFDPRPGHPDPVGYSKDGTGDTFVCWECAK